jgi:hypothetical protein
MEQQMADNDGRSGLEKRVPVLRPFPSRRYAVLDSEMAIIFGQNTFVRHASLFRRPLLKKIRAAAMSPAA